MLTIQKTLIVLGGSGFIGRYVIQEALKEGWKVKALVRSQRSASGISALGAMTFQGNAERPSEWIRETEGASAILDLIQPKLPARLGTKQMLHISLQRQKFASALVGALGALNADQRPLLISVSGIDDLAPDGDGCLSANSPLRTKDYGFSPIGIPVRTIIKQSGIGAAFVSLGTVYGPGKAFAETIFPKLAKGNWKNFGDRMALIHVEDAARGLMKIAGSDSARVAGRSFVLTDNAPAEMSAFFGLSAKCMGVAPPGRIPRWLASIVAGRSIVETMQCDLPIKSSVRDLPDFQLRYPSYREGLPAVLAKLGYIRADGAQ
jgi:NAD dependent epimerase/dehydratase family enzyme